MAELEKVLCQCCGHGLLRWSEEFPVILKEIRKVDNMGSSPLPWPLPRVAFVEIIHIGVSLPTLNECQYRSKEGDVVGKIDNPDKGFFIWHVFFYAVLLKYLFCLLWIGGKDAAYS